MSVAVIFGGAGYIGRNWTVRLASEDRFQRIVVADVRPPGGPMPERVEFRSCDVRRPIGPQLGSIAAEWIFNFAAVHREPGHEATEYFDTNLAGARHVCEFSEAVGCHNLLFTSSIAVYGPTPCATTEASPTYPRSPYGISKLCAELIHESWQRTRMGRRLVICRPGVIYGPGDPGNILRMIRAIQRGYFFFPGPLTLRKSYGYIHGLLESFQFAMTLSQPLLRYNYVERETETIGELVRIIRRQLRCSAPTFSVPLWLLQPAAAAMQVVTRGRSPIHPARVRKAATPTHIVPEQLQELGFRFPYDFPSSLEHWRSQAPLDFSRNGSFSGSKLRLEIQEGSREHN